LGQLLQLWPRNHVLKLLAQPWEGHINFTLPLTAFSLTRAAVNFTHREMVAAVREGELQVWEKLAAVRSSCAAEVAADECLRRLTREQRGKQRRRFADEGRNTTWRPRRAAIPSWLDLRSLGLQPSASMDDAAALEEQEERTKSLMLPGAAPGAEVGLGTICEVAGPEVAEGVAEVLQEEGERLPADMADEEVVEEEEEEYRVQGSGIEQGEEALRDLTALSLGRAGALGLDFIAP
jgi:hypothetical protein